MLKIKIAILALTLFAPAAFAQKKVRKKKKVQASEETSDDAGNGQAPTGLPPYGMAGCGLGSLVIEENTMWPQLGAMTTNNIVSPQTSAITSGTSNCTDLPREVALIEQEVFITANLNSLTKEAAQGSGEHLDALGEVMGCSEEGNTALRVLCKDRHEEIFSTRDSKKVLSTLRQEIKANEELAENCDRV